MLNVDTALPDLVTGLSKRFAKDGIRLTLVGGSVRDLILGRAVHDYDFSVDADPQTVRDGLAAYGIESVFDLTEDFRVIGFTHDGVPGQLRCLKVTSKSTGMSLNDDLHARDLTINAIALDLATSEVIDPCGGRADLEAGVIRFIPDARQTVQADPIRMIRAVRFANEFDFEIESGSSRTIEASASQIGGVASERMAKELERIILLTTPSRAIAALVEFGLLNAFLPELSMMQGLRQGPQHYLDVYDHTLSTLDSVPARLELRWAALLHDIAKPATFVESDTGISFRDHDSLGSERASTFLRTCGAAKALVSKVSNLIALHTRPLDVGNEWSDGAIRRLLRDAGDDLDDLFILAEADVRSAATSQVASGLEHLEFLKARCRQSINEFGARFGSPIDGDELIDITGRPAGPWVGEAKDYLTELVHSGDLSPGDRERARELVIKRWPAENPET